MSKKVTLDDRELQKLFRALSDVDILVGVQGKDATATKSTKDGKPTGTSALMVASVHEFGSSTPNPETGQLPIPERSFIRSTVKQQNKKYIKLLSKVVNKGIRTKSKPRFDDVGEQAVTDIKKKIMSNIPPKLRPATIARKGSSKALINTSQLLNSITSTVHKRSK